MSEEIIEGIKAPLRQFLLFAYAFAIDWVFKFLASKLGFEFTAEQKLLISGYGTGLVYFILSFVDKWLHEIGKARSTAKVTSRLVTGIARF